MFRFFIRKDKNLPNTEDKKATDNKASEDNKSSEDAQPSLKGIFDESMYGDMNIEGQDTSSRQQYWYDDGPIERIYRKTAPEKLIARDAIKILDDPNLTGSNREGADSLIELIRQSRDFSNETIENMRRFAELQQNQELLNIAERMARHQELENYHTQRLEQEREHDYGIDR